jgi:hypothetical protein
MSEKNSKAKMVKGKEIKGNKKGFFSSTLASLFILFLGVLSASYLSTGTYDFGGQFKKISSIYRRLVPGVMFSVSFLFHSCSLCRMTEFSQRGSSANTTVPTLQSRFT